MLWELAIPDRQFDVTKVRNGRNDIEEVGLLLITLVSSRQC